jgi:hypothetical protein
MIGTCPRAIAPSEAIQSPVWVDFAPPFENFTLAPLMLH